MGERCEEMVRVALDSFAARDVERARSLVELDELVDRTNRRVTGKVLEMASSPGLQEWGMRMIIVSRCLERIGDNAVDIGEQTAFVVTGEFQRVLGRQPLIVRKTGIRRADSRRGIPPCGGARP